MSIIIILVTINKKNPWNHNSCESKTHRSVFPAVSITIPVQPRLHLAGLPAVAVIGTTINVYIKIPVELRRHWAEISNIANTGTTINVDIAIPISEMSSDRIPSRRHHCHYHQCLLQNSCTTETSPARIPAVAITDTTINVYITISIAETSTYTSRRLLKIKIN